MTLPHLIYIIITVLSGRRGLRHVKMKWVNSDLKGYECVDSFEVKYWPRGKASRSFVTSAIEAKKDRKDRVYSTMLEVDECTEYTYVIRASKSNPSVVVNHRYGNTGCGFFKGGIHN